jgi:ATP-dependent helicase/nuclease subunit A
LALPTSNVEASQAAKLGRAVHRVLQWVTATQRAGDYHALAVAAVTEFDLPPSASDVVASYARTIRSSPALQRFFDPAQFAWSADEFDVVSQGETLRIDRLVQVGPAQRPSWWVLDYKLAFHASADETLRRQLTRYRDAVRTLAGDAPVHAAFVTGDGALHELEPLGPASE